MQEGTLYTFGLIGLGVMGQNFLLNVSDKGFSALGYDLDPEKAGTVSEASTDHGHLNATTDLKAFVNGLATPRKIMMLVPAGPIVDQVIEDLLPLIDVGDIIVDGGNSFYADTDRREAYLAEKGIHFFGTGVSGGAEGARKGPSIMPGGSREAYTHLQPIFEAVAAQYKDEPCVAWLGPRSAGNYVKMVHNGIEYGLMQLTAEIYDLLKTAGGMDHASMASSFAKWDAGRLQSFLVEITAKILAKEDPLEKGYLVERILDKAKQKGTGKWTSQNGMDLGIPVPTIDMAVSMRQISALKDQRTQAETLYQKTTIAPWNPADLVPKAESALYFAFIATYAQGMHLLAEASKAYDYELNLTDISKIWRAGCIIRASLLAEMAEAFKTHANIANLMLSPGFVPAVNECLPDIREVVAFGAAQGLALPCLSSALSYFDALSSARLPLNLVQAQRDFFGSHTYERTDREGTFHTDW